MEVVTPSPLPIQIGDYIDYGTERFYLNSAPNVEKLSNFTHRQLIDLEGEIYFLYNKIFMDEGQADFSYHGDPNAFLQLLLTNITEIQPGWSIAAVDVAEAQTLSFANDTCRQALTKVAEAFEMEYRLSGKAIYLQKSVGAQTAYSFEYGRGKGLYSLNRETVDEKGLLTRVFGFGARKNIDTSYRNGATRLVFEDRFLENNQALYGIREGAVTFDDIFPQRTSTVTAIDAGDPLEITDNTLDFDLDDYLIEGTVAKVVFKTGALAGYEFEIERYSHATKTITFLPFQEENGYELPNALNKPDINDQYTLVDIRMPQTYIDAAEAILQQRTQEYLDENSVPRVTYSITIDEKYVKAQGVTLRPGDIVNVTDPDLGVDADIRVTEVGFPLVNPSQIAATFSDTIPYTTQERLIATAVDNVTLTKNVDRRRAELARRSTARLRKLQDLVFDPDGYFDPVNIKPLSIETLMLSVGAKSQNFGLMSVALLPNAGGDPNALNITAGQLVHYEIEIEGLGYIWVMDPRNFAGLDPLKPYYLYAKCSTAALTGVWELSEVSIGAEDITGQYHFALGILYPVADGRRDFDFTNGMTFINGDTITTGTIKSLDGLCYFNLTEGKLFVGDGQYSFDWNVTNPGRLTIRGSIIQTPAGDPVVLPNLRGAYSGAASYFEGDVVTYLGDSYRNITTAATTGILPTNGTHWELFLPQGADGADGAQGPQGPAGADGADGQDGNDGPGIVYRGSHSATAVYYNNPLRRDVVLHSGVYYLYNGVDGGSGTFNISNWENFGAQFTSVATDLLLAEQANIADWRIKSGKISSQQEVDGTPKAVLDGNNGKITLYNESTVYNTTGSPTGGVAHTIELDAVYGGFRAFRPAASDQPASEVRIRPDHVRITGAQSKGGGDVYLGQRIGIEADVSARQRYAVQTEYIAAIYGNANNTEGSNPAPAYGGYFEGIRIGGRVTNKIKSVTTNNTLSRTDYFVMVKNTGSAITITLPANPVVGDTYVVKRANTGGVFVSGGTIDLYHDQNEGTSLGIGSVGEAFLCIYDGTFWQIHIFA